MLLVALAASVVMSAVEVATMTAAVDAVCPPLTEEAALVSAIELERANPSGVVSLRRLHELGETLAEVRIDLSEARRAHVKGLELFRRWARKQLDVGFCESWERRR